MMGKHDWAREGDDVGLTVGSVFPSLPSLIPSGEWRAAESCDG